MAISNTVDTLRIEILEGVGKAWDKADIDTLMLFMSEDCIYSASVGPEPGKTYTGREEVRHGFEEMLAYDEGTSLSGDTFISGDKAISEWAYIIPNRDGSKTEIKGLDIFTFNGNKIRSKDAYRKTYPS